MPRESLQTTAKGTNGVSYLAQVPQASPRTAEEQLAFWRQTLKDAPALLDLPADRPRPAQPGNTTARQPISFPAEIAESVRNLANREACSPFVIVLAGFQALLSRYSGTTDIVAGCVAKGDRSGTSGNVAALRADLSGNPEFREIIGRVRRVVQDAFANATLPFERVLAELSPQPNASYAPIFQVMFAYEHQKSDQSERASLPSAPHQTVHDQFSKVDIRLHLTETAEGVSGWIEYNTDLFNPDRMTRMVTHFEAILRAATQAPSQRLASLPLMSES
jgi:non-ribosomal peptide synthetase component F